MRFVARFVAIAGLSAIVACPSTAEPGEFGTFRFAGRAKGKPPLALLPPVTDRAGNIYVLYGGLAVPETAVFVGKIGGGWTSGCALTKGDRFGAHGWVGFDERRHWYWSGDALVSVAGDNADCHRVLDRDPGTDVNLQFKAVLPWVRDAPSRTTIVALVQSPIDAVPYSALVDLEAEILTNIRGFEPGNATEVTVIGVGADRVENVGFALMQYKVDGNVTLEARFYDAEANETARARIPSEALQPYGVQGYLQSNKEGLVAGLLEGDKLVTFDRNGGRVRAIEGMTPVGVHRSMDELWLVGTASDRPVLAAIGGSGNVGGIGVWTASETAADNLRGPQDVRDDRSLPSRATTWQVVTTAMGAFPFLHAHTPSPHTTDGTLWLVGGPSFDTGGARVTAFAVAPVGITYP